MEEDSKIKHLMLNELKSKINTTKPTTTSVAKFDGQKTPTAIFQYGITTNDPEILFKPDKKELRKLSSASSSDSGFAITPGTPPPHLSAITDLVSKPQDISYAIPRNATTNSSVDITLVGSPTPPPLPASSPPLLSTNAFEDYDKDADIDGFTSSESEDDNSENHSVSDTDSSTCESSSSDEYDTYNVTQDAINSETTETKDDDTVLPFQIAKLEGSVKTVRSKIKRGTVFDMKKIFVNKAKRIKRENKRSKHRKYKEPSVDPFTDSNVYVNKNMSVDDAVKIQTKPEVTITTSEANGDVTKLENNISNSENSSSRENTNIYPEDTKLLNITRQREIADSYADVSVFDSRQEEQMTNTFSKPSSDKCILQNSRQVDGVSLSTNGKESLPECTVDSKEDKGLSQNKVILRSRSDRQNRSPNANRASTGSNLTRRRSFVMTLKQFYDDGQGVPKDFDYVRTLKGLQAEKDEMANRSDILNKNVVIDSQKPKESSTLQYSTSLKQSTLFRNDFKKDNVKVSTVVPPSNLISRRDIKVKNPNDRVTEQNVHEKPQLKSLFNTLSDSDNTNANESTGKIVKSNEPRSEPYPVNCSGMKTGIQPIVTYKTLENADSNKHKVWENKTNIEIMENKSYADSTGNDDVYTKPDDVIKVEPLRRQLFVKQENVPIQIKHESSVKIPKVEIFENVINSHKSKCVQEESLIKPNNSTNESDRFPQKDSKTIESNIIDGDSDLKKSVTVIRIGEVGEPLENNNLDNNTELTERNIDTDLKTKAVITQNSEANKKVYRDEKMELPGDKTATINSNSYDIPDVRYDNKTFRESLHNLSSSKSYSNDDKVDFTKQTVRQNKPTVINTAYRNSGELSRVQNAENSVENKTELISDRHRSQIEGINDLRLHNTFDSASANENTFGDPAKKQSSSIHLLPLTTDVNKTSEISGNCSEVSVVNQDECLDVQNTNNERKTPSFVTFNSTGADEKSNQACLSSGSSNEYSTPHVVSSLTGIVLTNTKNTQQVSDGCCGSEEADEKSKIPEFYTLPETLKTGKIVTLKEIPARRRMPEKSSGYTSSSSEGSGYTGGKKISTQTMTLHSSNKDGRIVNEQEGELESNIHVKHLAETMSLLNGDNNDELLPEINQTVTKLPGGNLVITTLTHKIVEEEEEKQNEHESILPEEVGEHYVVQDHKGNYYMIEDITDETQESAYYSSSDTHNTSQSSMSGYDKHGQFQGISNLKSVGKSGISYDTAEEVLLGLYNPPGFMEIQEYDENSYEGKYSRERERHGAPGQHYPVAPYGIRTDSSVDKRTTTYSYDDVDNRIQRPNAQNVGSSNVKTIKHSYEMESTAPWMTDGTTGYKHDTDSVSGFSEHDEGYTTSKREAMQTTETHADSAGLSSMNASYMLQSSATMIPPIIPPPIIPPLILPPPQPIPQYRVAKLDLTPNVCTHTTHLVAPPISTKISESNTHEKVTDVTKEVEKKQVTETERPVYKTVALVKGPYESPKWHKMKRRNDSESSEEKVENRKYKIVNSRASDDFQAHRMEYSTSNAVYQMQRSDYDENKNISLCKSVPQQKFKTEKVFQINGTSPSPATNRNFQTRINVTRDMLDSSHITPRHNDPSNYEYMEENKTTRTEMKMHNETQNTLDRNVGGKDMRVVRGNILIKNVLDDNLEEYSDNINLFDQAFNMSKDNPLYQSDEDLYKRVDLEREYERQRQQDIQNDITNDITFETVDRYTKSKEVKRQQENQRRPKQTLSQLLLSKLSSIDSKDIRQYIDVKHHHEDIYGDVNFVHADGSMSHSDRTSNFDSVGENVDLMLKEGKAFITIKVTAERITPVDLEFNVWRKNQAIVTRVIEIDFFANEQRRRLYENVMDRASERDSDYTRHGRRFPRETILTSQETLDLFSDIMDVAEGEGDKEDITVKTSQRKTFVPGNNPDFMY